MTMRTRSGLTLMELVIALAITGMMAAAGAAAFTSVIDHRQVLREASVSTERAAALRETIESWVGPGNILVPQGGGPRGLTRATSGRTAGAAGSNGMNAAAVSAAQAAGDEIRFTTSALNPSMLPDVRIRLYVDADNNTPEKGLAIEYQSNAQMPLVRRMLDSTIDSLTVEFLDRRTNQWIGAQQAATISTRAVRLRLHSSDSAASPILGLPIIVAFGSPARAIP